MSEKPEGRQFRHSIKDSNFDPNIQFILSPDQIRKDTSQLIKEILLISKDVYRPEYYIINTVIKKLWNWGFSDPEIKEEIQSINQIINLNLKEVTQVIGLVNPFKFLWQSGVAEVKIEQMIWRVERRNLLKLISHLEEEFTLEMDKALVLRIFDLIQQVQNELDSQIPNEIYLNLVVVDCEKVKRQMTNILIDLQFRLENLVSQRIFQEMDGIIQSFDQSQTRLELKFETAERLVELESFLEDLRKVVLPKLKTRFKKGVEWIRMMIPKLKGREEFKLELFRQAYQRIKNSREFLISHAMKLAQQREEIEGRIEMMKHGLCGRLEETMKELDKIREKDEEYLCDKILKDLENLRQKVEDFKGDARVMEKEERILGKRGKRIKMLDQFEKELEMFRELWIMFELWIKVKNVERSRSLLQEDMKELWRKVDRIRTIGDILEKEFQRDQTKYLRQLDLIRKILNNLEAFWKYAKVLQFLCNPNLKVRHWDFINNVLAEKEREFGFDNGLNANVELTWNNLEDLELNNYYDKLKLISDGADREAEIEEQLRLMTKFWESLRDLSPLLNAEKQPPLETIQNESGINRSSLVIQSSGLIKMTKKLMTQTIEENLTTLQKIEMFCRFPLFEEKVEALKRTITKSKYFLELLEKLERYLKDINLFFGWNICLKNLKSEIGKAREIEDRVHSILRGGEDLGIDRVMASKENEYLLENFEKELLSIHSNLWEYVYSLRQNHGRLYWLTSQELIRGDRLVNEYARKLWIKDLAKSPITINKPNNKEFAFADMDKDDKTRVDYVIKNIHEVTSMVQIQNDYEELGSIISKMFRGIHKVEMGCSGIVSIKGYNGEIIRLNEPILIKDGLGYVVGQLESVFKKQLKDEVFKGLGTFSITKKSDFVKDRWCQIIFLVKLIVWTFELESNLEGEGVSGLTDSLFQCNEFFGQYKEFQTKVDRSKSFLKKVVKI